MARSPRPLLSQLATVLFASPRIVLSGFSDRSLFAARVNLLQRASNPSSKGSVALRAQAQSQGFDQSSTGMPARSNDRMSMWTDPRLALYSSLGISPLRSGQSHARPLWNSSRCCAASSTPSNLMLPASSQSWLVRCHSWQVGHR